MKSFSFGLFFSISLLLSASSTSFAQQDTSRQQREPGDESPFLKKENPAVGVGSTTSTEANRGRPRHAYNEVGQYPSPGQKIPFPKEFQSEEGKDANLSEAGFAVYDPKNTESPVLLSEKAPFERFAPDRNEISEDFEQIQKESRSVKIINHSSGSSGHDVYMFVPNGSWRNRNFYMGYNNSFNRYVGGSPYIHNGVYGYRYHWHFAYNAYFPRCFPVAYTVPVCYFGGYCQYALYYFNSCY